MPSSWRDRGRRDNTGRFPKKGIRMARKTDKVTLPVCGATAEIRQLSWLQLRASRTASQQESARGLVAMGGAEFMATLKAITAEKARADGDTDAPAEKAVPDLLAGHDLMTVLVGGAPGYSRAQIEDLDEADAEFLGRAILALTPKRTEDEEKNAASPSTAA
jgi:hypothetical protein